MWCSAECVCMQARACRQRRPCAGGCSSSLVRPLLLQLLLTWMACITLDTTVKMIPMKAFLDSSHTARLANTVGPVSTYTRTSTRNRLVRVLLVLVLV